MFDHLKHSSKSKPKRYRTFSYTPRYHDQKKVDFEARRQEIRHKMRTGRENEIGATGIKEETRMGKKTKLISLAALGFIIFYVWFALGFTYVSIGVSAVSAYIFVKLSNR